MMPKGQTAWACIRLQGCHVIKLNLSFYYQTGLQVGRLANMPVGATRVQIAIQSAVAENYVRFLITNPDMPLRACRAQGEALLAAITAVQVKMREYAPTDPAASPGQWNVAVTWQDTEFNNVLSVARTFETVLMADLDTLASYYVERKGIYDTDWLIQGAEQALPKSMSQYLDQQAIEDMRSSGRCLALDAPTASAFHILRATESILYRYYLVVCKPAKKEPLLTWAAYLSALYKASGDEKQVTDSEVREVYNILTRMKDHRNNIMHPEMVLDEDQAFTLFENAKSAIMVMLPRLSKVEADAESPEPPVQTEAQRHKYLASPS